MHRAALLVSLVVALVAVPAALAHTPVFGGEGKLLDAETSYARYSAIDRSATTRTYRVRVGRERRLLVELLVPDRAPENELPAASLPRVVVLGGDARRWTLPRIRRPFDEPFTRTSYLSIGRRLLTDVEPGVLELTVSGPSSSRFVLVTGTREAFGVGDAARLPLTIARVQTWYREGMTTPPGRIGTVFWLIPVIAGLLLAILASALGWVVAAIVHRLRHRRASPQVEASVP